MRAVLLTALLMACSRSEPIELHAQPGETDTAAWADELLVSPTASQISFEYEGETITLSKLRKENNQQFTQRIKTIILKHHSQ
jgi:hypothetical protein